MRKLLLLHLARICRVRQVTSSIEVHEQSEFMQPVDHHPSAGSATATHPTGWQLNLLSV